MRPTRAYSTTAVQAGKSIAEKYTSLTSKTHMRLASKRDKTRVKAYAEAGLEDYEKEHAKREKARDDEIRSRMTYGQGETGKTGGRGGRNQYVDYGMDDGTQTGDLGALKAQFKRGRGGSGRGRDMDEGRLMAAKASQEEADDSISDLSDKDAPVIQESDSDDGAAGRSKKRAKNVMSDEDSD